MEVAWTIDRRAVHSLIARSLHYAIAISRCQMGRKFIINRS
ncbi:MAG: hypothetical protein VKN72_11705 [Nostocales cyanobacterium 94392]|nr:hypothetical protein [Nostocales cyanobacterium 94392]